MSSVVEGTVGRKRVEARTHGYAHVLAHKRELNYAVGKYRLSLKLPRSLPIDLRCNMSITLAM